MRDFGRPIQQIIIHCTATSQNATVEQIKTYWKNVLGWSQVGYHYIIGINGERHILAHLSQVTNGVRGYNWNSVHISYIGGKGGVDDRTEAQKQEMLNLIKELRSDSILGAVPVFGHRDLSPDANGDGIINKHDWIKLCPSFDVKSWLANDSAI
jgi:N-acetyl-anhydromuramyl-L-alanine amidase AmpD